MNKKTFNRIKDMAKPYLKGLLIISILSLLVSICEIIRPYLIKQVIDNYLSKGIYKDGMYTIGLIGALYIFIVLIENIINFISTNSTTAIGENVVADLRNKLFRFSMYSNIPFHDKTPAGKLYVRITNDTNDISALFTDVISTIFKDILLVISLIVIMIYFSFELSMMSFIVLPFIVFTSLILTKIMNAIDQKAKAIKTKLNTFLAESIYGAKLIKIFNIQKEKQDECSNLTSEFAKQSSKQGVISALLSGTMSILENIGISLILITCLNHWFDINLEVGLMFVFMTYLKQLFEPITNLVENIEIIEEAVVSIDKIYDILDNEQDLENLEKGIKLKKVIGKIEFKNVWFAYKDENWVLKDVSFTIEPGESIALVGKTGSRKNYNYKFN